jgi:octaprenyl-diphosphate synthase
MFVAETSAVAAPAKAVSILSWKEIAKPIDSFLNAVTQCVREQVREFDGGIGTYAEYALNGNGKQLRPALVALSANAIGQRNDAHVTVATIIEMVHLATLIHDDVMDEAEIRRGRATLAANWGNEIAVLLGDCLFAHSLKLAASFPTPEICRAVASATNTVCAGEILQNQQRKNCQLSRADYFKVLEMKTAELFALSCDLGGYLSGATPSQRVALRQFGLALGTAYQVYDDCVDLFGSEAAVGKSLGTDLAKGKLTLPALLFLERANPAEKLKAQEWIKKSEPQDIASLIKLLTQQDIFTDSIEVIEQYLDKARETAAMLPEPAGLLALTDYLAQQTESFGNCA